MKLGFCRKQEPKEVEVPSKLLKVMNSFVKVRSAVRLWAAEVLWGETMVVERTEKPEGGGTSLVQK